MFYLKEVGLFNCRINYLSVIRFFIAAEKMIFFISTRERMLQRIYSFTDCSAIDAYVKFSVPSERHVGIIYALIKPMHITSFTYEAGSMQKKG